MQNRVIAVALAVMLLTPIALAGKRRESAAAPVGGGYDKSDILTWLNGEGTANSTGNPCTSADINQANGPYDISSTKEFTNGGDTSGTFGHATFLKVSTAAALSGSCGFELTGASAVAELVFDVSSGDLVSSGSGCFGFELKRKIDDPNDGNCELITARGSTVSIFTRVRYLSGTDDFGAQYKDGTNHNIANTASNEITDEAQVFIMVKYDEAATKKVIAYIDGVERKDDQAPNPSSFDFETLRIGTDLATCGTGVAYYIDTVVFSDDVDRCIGTTLDTLYEIIMGGADGSTDCTGGCKDYDDF